MKKKIDISSWERKEVFEYFSKFEYPMGGITENVDVTELYNYAKSTGRSFYITTVYNALLAANSIENFRLRISNGEVWLYDKVGIGPTYLRHKDKTLAFTYFPYCDDIEEFTKKARAAEAEAEAGTGLNLKNENVADDLICYSCVPWTRFTAIAEPFTPSASSLPHIVTGKFFKEGDRIMMPVSVKLHHALGDGYHISLFFERFSHLMF